jgi:hypothetical protein
MAIITRGVRSKPLKSVFPINNPQAGRRWMDSDRRRQGRSVLRVIFGLVRRSLAITPLLGGVQVDVNDKNPANIFQPSGFLSLRGIDGGLDGIGDRERRCDR